MTNPLTLRIVPDAELYPTADPAALRRAPSAPGVRAVLEPAAPFDYPCAQARLVERSRGLVRPDGVHPWLARDTAVCRSGPCWWTPRFGMLVGEDGSVPFASIGGPLTDPDKLAQAPGLARAGEDWRFTPPAGGAPVLEGASVFMPWGGGFNYGHMVLDALTSLLALEEAGLLAELPPTAPPLKRWQRELIALLLGRQDAVRETAAPVVRLAQAAHATSMDHYLHAPNALVGRVRERLLSRVGEAHRGAKRVYLSRRSHAHTMRILLNEAELEEALERRGFTVVRPERLRPAEQIALVREAEVVVGPSGAAMANALFAPPGARVIDIQPELFTSAWTPALCEQVGQDWRVYYAPAPAPEGEVPWSRRMRRGFRFAYRLPLDDFLNMLDGEVLA